MPQEAEYIESPPFLGTEIIKQRETDEELVLRARSGNAEAFGALVERHQKSVLSFLLTFFHNLDLAEEATQRAFVKAFKAIPSFEGRSSFKTWISRIALNEARLQRRWDRLKQWFSAGYLDKNEDETWEDRVGD